MMFSASVYYINCVAGAAQMLGLYMGMLGFACLLSMALMPIAIKVGKTPKKALIGTQGITAVLYLILFFVGKNSFPLLLILSFAAGLFSCMQNGLINILLNDTIDYVMLKDKVSLNGVISSIKSFANKCGSGFAISIITLIISIAGYDATLPVQSETAITGINIARFGAPSIISILLIICMLFYPIDKHYKEINEMKQNMKASDE